MYAMAHIQKRAHTKQTDSRNRQIKNLKESIGNMCWMFWDETSSTGTDICKSLAYISRSLSAHSVAILRAHTEFILGPVACEMLDQWDQHPST